MFCIKTKSSVLKLEVVPVASLLLHEKILPRMADSLILEFKNWVNLQNPIIIGENYIVLDGHHRAYAFKKLNFKYIPVCKIDYDHKATQLRYWFRLLKNADSMESFKKLVNEMNGNFREVDGKDTLEKRLDKNRFSFGIQRQNFFASISFKEEVVHDAVDAYNRLEEIQGKLLDKGVKITYVPCQSVHKKEFLDKLQDHEIVIWTPRITKDMVVAAISEKKVFAPKTTRHLIPVRPINVNIPTHWFKENISLEEINTRFVEFLQKKRIRRFGPGQVVDGRYYEEELFAFYDEKK
jgi:hypothetical protein